MVSQLFICRIVFSTTRGKMLSTISVSRKTRSLLSTKWVKLTSKISHFFGPGTWTMNNSIENTFLKDQRGLSPKLVERTNKKFHSVIVNGNFSL